MHKITSIAASAGTAPFATLTLPFERRQICRQRVLLDNGDEASLIIDRGTVLRDGDLLTTEDGKFIQVRAADETVSTVYTEDCQQLARAGTPIPRKQKAGQRAAILRAKSQMLLRAECLTHQV